MEEEDNGEEFRRRIKEKEERRRRRNSQPDLRTQQVVRQVEGSRHIQICQVI